MNKHEITTHLLAGLLSNMKISIPTEGSSIQSSTSQSEADEVNHRRINDRIKLALYAADELVVALHTT